MKSFPNFSTALMIAGFSILSFTLISAKAIVTSEFVNKIISVGKCNTFGYDQYVQNTDATAAYDVTVKIIYFKPG